MSSLRTNLQNAEVSLHILSVGSPKFGDELNLPEIRHSSTRDVKIGRPLPSPNVPSNLGFDLIHNAKQGLCSQYNKVTIEPIVYLPNLSTSDRN